MSVKEKMTAIADAIRKKTGGTDVLNLDGMAEAIPDVYEAGQKAECDFFWNEYLRDPYWVYRFAGQGWTPYNFKPNQDIVVSGVATGLFRQNTIRDLNACFGQWCLDLSNVTGSSYIFAYSNIEKLSVKIGENFAFQSSSFEGCTQLTRLILSGTLATNGLDLHWSTKLDKESLLNILGVLQDKTSAGGTWTVTLGSTNLAKLTDAEKAIATQKGWTLV